MTLKRSEWTPAQIATIESEVRAAMEVARKNAFKEMLLWHTQVVDEVSHYRRPGRRWAESALAALKVHLAACLERGMPYEPFK